MAEKKQPQNTTKSKNVKSTGAAHTKQQSRTRRAAYSPAAAAVERIYDRSAPLLMFESLVLGIGAIVMMFWPVAVLTTMTIVIGIALVLFGLYRTIAGFVMSHNMGGGWLDVIFGLINVVVGVLFYIYPVGSIIGVVYIFIILFFAKSLQALVFAINMVRARWGHYWWNLIMALILVALAVALIIWPMAGAVFMVYWIAVTLLLYAVADMYMFVVLRRLKNHVAD